VLWVNVCLSSGGRTTLQRRNSPQMLAETNGVWDQGASVPVLCPCPSGYEKGVCGLPVRNWQILPWSQGRHHTAGTRRRS